MYTGYKSYTITTGNECNLRILILMNDGYVLDLSSVKQAKAFIGDKYVMKEVEDAHIEGYAINIPLHEEQKEGKYDIKVTAILDDDRQISACIKEMIIRSHYGEASPAEIVAIMEEKPRDVIQKCDGTLVIYQNGKYIEFTADMAEMVSNMYDLRKSTLANGN